jgi:hypothetical protein
MIPQEKAERSKNRSTFFSFSFDGQKRKDDYSWNFCKTPLKTESQHLDIVCHTRRIHFRHFPKILFKNQIYLKKCDHVLKNENKKNFSEEKSCFMAKNLVKLKLPHKN